MYPQLTRDWESRFRQGDTPWEDLDVAPGVANLVRENLAPGRSILEVGAGLGVTALWLARSGYRVSACDVSPTAMRELRAKAVAAGVVLDLHVCDVVPNRARLPRVEAVLDRGVFHTFTSGEGRSAFATAMAALTRPGGLWLDVSGAAETLEDAGAALEKGWPRITLEQIRVATDPWFQLQSAIRTTYGTSSETSFPAFACVLRRRGERRVEG